MGKKCRPVRGTRKKFRTDVSELEHVVHLLPIVGIEEDLRRISSQPSFSLALRKGDGLHVQDFEAIEDRHTAETELARRVATGTQLEEERGVAGASAVKGSARPIPKVQLKGIPPAVRSSSFVYSAHADGVSKAVPRNTGTDAGSFGQWRAIVDIALTTIGWAQA